MLNRKGSHLLHRLQAEQLHFYQFCKSRCGRLRASKGLRYCSAAWTLFPVLLQMWPVLDIRELLSLNTTRDMWGGSQKAWFPKLSIVHNISAQWWVDFCSILQYCSPICEFLFYISAHWPWFEPLNIPWVMVSLGNRLIWPKFIIDWHTNWMQLC